MKEEFQNVLNSLPKRLIVSILVIAMGIVVFLVGYIGNSWYSNWNKSKEADKEEIIEVFRSEIKEFSDDNIRMHQRTDQNIERISNKVDVFSDKQDEDTKRLLKQIDKDFKRDESMPESYYLPEKIDPIESELQSFAPDPTFKKKLIQ